MRRCDVLVVGAGPAGSSAALAAAKGGARVLMVDRKKEAGVPVQCAEFIPIPVLQRCSEASGIICQSVTTMRTHLPDGEVVSMRSKGAICNRGRFDAYLAGRAVDAGAEVIRGASAFRLTNGVVLVNGGGVVWEIRPAVIVGADGPSSVVRQWMQLRRNDCVRGRQYLLPLGCKLETTEIYFHNQIPGGYGWLFPKGEVANVGIGVEPRYEKSSLSILKNFVNELHGNKILKDVKPLAVTGGLIPVGGPAKVWRGNIVLAGDAAGHCHPVSGAGIANAIFAGELAGEAAALAAGRHDVSFLAEYQEACRLFLDGSLKRAAGKREFLAPFWGKGAKRLSAALKKSWIAFEDYYQD